MLKIVDEKDVKKRDIKPGSMELVDECDVVDVGEDPTTGDDVRDILISVMKKMGFEHIPVNDLFDNEKNDLFTLEDRLVELTITDRVDPEVLKQIVEGDE